MANNEILDKLLHELIAEKSPKTDIQVPVGIIEKRNLLRVLMNARPPLLEYSAFLKHKPREWL